MLSTDSSKSAGYMGNDRTGYRVLEAEGVSLSVYLTFITSMVVWRGEGTTGGERVRVFQRRGITVMSGPSCLIVQWAHRGWKAGFLTQTESCFLANKPGSLWVGEVVDE
jgi:hypothetical protein